MSQRSLLVALGFCSEGNPPHRRQLAKGVAIALVLVLMVGLSSAGLLFFAHPLLPAQAASSPPAIGINLQLVADYSTDVLFADAMKTWRLNAAPGQSNPPALDANGWPQGDFQAFLWDGLPHITGTYALRFTGKAVVGLALVNGSVNNQSYDSAANITTASIVITSEGQAALNFTSTQRTSGSPVGSGITNIQFMRPTSTGASTSYSFSTTFTTPIKQLIANFQVIRFMDYSSTNSNGQVNWSDRRLPQENQEGPAHNSNSYGWEGLGGAWEYAIQLANETNRDAYIDIPAMATGRSPSDTSSYVYKLAQLLKYGSDANGNVYTSTQSNPVHPPLNSNLHLYIEYSNEVWNFGGAFDQSRQNYNAAQSEVAAGTSPLNYDGETNTYYWGWRRIAERIKETSDIFRAVFGDSAMPPNSNPRIRPVMEWQYDNLQDTAHQQLSFLNGYYNNGDGKQHVSTPHPVNYFLWGGGGASYFSSNNDSAGTVDGIYNSGIPSSGYQSTIQGEVQWAQQYGLHDVAYEGGWGLTGSVAEQAKLDGRAKQAIIDAQNQFTQAGGELNIYFESAGGDYALCYSIFNGKFTGDITSQNTPEMQGIYAILQSSAPLSPTPTATPSPTPNSGGTVLSGSNINDGGGPWNGGSNTANKAFDGNTSTFYDAATATGAWTGIDLGSGHSATVSSIRYYPRSDYPDRMVGGSFQGSNDATNWTTLANVSSQPPVQWNTITVNGSTAYRYLRYLSAGTNSFGNIAEVQFMSTASGTTPTPTPTPTGSGWTKCADEWNTCSFSGTKVVRFGANGSYAYQTATGSISCNNSVFGDPSPGNTKACFVANVPPSGWTKCADEWNTCTVSGTVSVAFGAGSAFLYKTVTGSVSCTTSSFGSDPVPGTTKACYSLPG